MNSTIVFFGNSITAAGKTALNPLGEGYVFFVSTRLAQDPQYSGINIVNSGINGHTVGDLLNRYEQDVIPHNPDTIVVKIGVNDAYNDFMSGIQRTELIRFEQNYSTLLANIRAKLPESRILLLTPFYIAENKQDALYLRVADYIGIVKSLGMKNGLAVLDTQAIFDRAMIEMPAIVWAEDGVHPIVDGHKLLAKELYSKLLKSDY